MSNVTYIQIGRLRFNSPEPDSSLQTTCDFTGKDNFMQWWISFGKGTSVDPEKKWWTFWVHTPAIWEILHLYHLLFEHIQWPVKNRALTFCVNNIYRLVIYVYKWIYAPSTTLWCWVRLYNHGIPAPITQNSQGNLDHYSQTLSLSHSNGIFKFKLTHSL